MKWPLVWRRTLERERYWREQATRQRDQAMDTVAALKIALANCLRSREEHSGTKGEE